MLNSDNNASQEDAQKTQQQGNDEEKLLKLDEVKSLGSPSPQMNVSSASPSPSPSPSPGTLSSQYSRRKQRALSYKVHKAESSPIKEKFNSLDRNPKQLTEFPDINRNMTDNAFVASLLSLSENLSSPTLNNNIPSHKDVDEISLNNSAVDPARQESVVLDNSKVLLDMMNTLGISGIGANEDSSHWMSDENCINCYDCGKRFQLFRRKHHCRICGQIFCSSCCFKTVKVEKHTQPVRTCNLCFSALMQMNLKEDPASINELSFHPTKSHDVISMASNSHSSSVPNVKETILNLNSTLPHKKSLTIQEVENESRERMVRQFSDDVFDPTNVEETKEALKKGRTLPPKIVVPNHIDHDEIGANETEKYVSDNPRHSVAEMINPDKNEDIFTQVCEEVPTLQVISTDGISGNFDVAAENNSRSLEMLAYSGHLKLCVSRLLRTGRVCSEIENPVEFCRWRDLIVNFCQKAIRLLRIHVRPEGEDQIDLSQYVKIKTMPEGSINNCQYFEGVVFRKNLAHKRMRSFISDPRILLFNCALEFQRHNKITSLEVVSKQEEEYTSIILQKIMYLKPDIVVVSKSVSRSMQDGLREANVSVLVNVKNDILLRLSRSTGAKILESAEQVDQVSSSAIIGTCKIFKLFAIEYSANANPVSGDVSRRQKYICFDGCKPERFGTICLRGKSKAFLRRVKLVLRRSIHIFSSLTCEQSLLRDLRAFYSEKELQRELTRQETDLNRDGQVISVDTFSVSEALSTSPFLQFANHKRSSSDVVTINKRDTVPLVKAQIAAKKLLAATEAKSPGMEKNLASPAVGQMDTINEANAVELDQLPTDDENNADKKSDPDVNLDSILQGIIICECLLASFDSRQCIEPSTKHVEFYSTSDQTLFQFLNEVCFNPNWRCSSESCKSKKIHKHLWTVWHGTGRLEIRVKKLKQPIRNDLLSSGTKFRMLMWSYCRDCAAIVTPLVDMSEKTSQLSFAKFLELTFYNESARCRAIECSHSAFRVHDHFFSSGNFVARFSYEPCEQYTVRFGGNLLYSQFNPSSLAGALEVHNSSDFWVVEFKALKFIAEAAFSAFVIAVGNALSHFSSVETTATALQDLHSLKDEISHEKEFFWSELERLWVEISTADCSGGWGSYFSLRVNRLKFDLRRLCQQWNTLLDPRSTIAFQEIKTPNAEGINLNLDSNINSKITMAGSKPPEASPRSLLSEFKHEQSLILAPHFSFKEFNPQQFPDVDNTESLPNDASFVKESAAGTFGISMIPKITQPQSFKVDLLSLVTENMAPIKDHRYSSAWLGSTDGSGHIALHPVLTNCATVIFEDEPSSIISYTLHSWEYMARLHKMNPEELRNLDAAEQRKLFSDVYPMDILSRSEQDKASMKESPADCPSNTTGEIFTGDEDEEPVHQFDEDSLLLDDSEAFTHKFMMSYSNVTTSFECKVYFPIQFHSLRQQFLGSDIDFMQSIARCAKWGASGGKSGSTFSKTMDDRYIMKYVKRREFKMYIDFAKQYFAYMAKAFFHQCPTLLVKVLGVYQITWKKSNNQKLAPKYVVVMPNLFYSTTLKTVFDLKGSIRNRLVKDEESVLLDENFILYTKGFPLPLSSKSKELLRMSVHNDTLFLSKQEIVDYSILVGIDDIHKELVVGIIDYLRQYTWDKQVESGVKQIIPGKGAPTILSPRSYKKRFRLAMERYFMVIPGRFSKPKQTR